VREYLISRANALKEGASGATAPLVPRQEAGHAGN